MEEEASQTERLMVLVDESPGAKHAVNYVARMIGHRRGFHVCLVCLLPPLPPELLEFGGAEIPRKEEELSAKLHRDQQLWIASVKGSARQALDDAIDALRKAGLSSGEIDVEYSDPMDVRDADVAILDLARAKQCHTIVIGDKTHSSFRELSGGHLSDHLLQHAREITIWSVQ